MTVFQALVLGLLQGLTELLPISSSAHLMLVPWLLGWPDHGLAFDVALHFGTLLAIVWYFRREWADLIRAALRIVMHRRVETEEERRVVFLIVATIPAVIAGLLLDEYVSSVLRDPRITATTLIVMGILLWFVDRTRPNDRLLGTMRGREALLVGLAQALALVPGVSRSGATITMGRALRFDRKSAAVFSFLMSMPVIAGAAILKVPDAIAESGFSLPLIVGVSAAAVSSWLAINILLRYVTKYSYGVFAAYRIVLGVAVFILLAYRGG